MIRFLGCIVICGASFLAAPLRAQSLPNISEVLSVGALEGDVDDVFGQVTDVAALQGGRFVALDNRLQVLRLYSRDGELLSGAGRAGQGPGEFRWVESVAASGDLISVLDRGNARLTLFALDGDSLMYDSDFRLPFQAWDHCALDDRIFLVGVHGDHVIHEVDRTGSVVRSFERVTEPGDFSGFEILVRQLLSYGFIECSESERRVYFFSKHRGFARAYTDSGAHIWTAELPGWLGMTPTLTERGTLIYAPDEETMSWTVGQTVSLVHADLLLVQADSVWLPSDDSHHKVVSYLIDAEDGGRVARTSGIPFVGDASWPRLYGWEKLPFPRVRVLSLERR